jgi:hypothetical protein
MISTKPRFSKIYIKWREFHFMKRVIIVSKETSNNLKEMQELISKAGGLGGCEACCSGDPLEFRIEEMMSQQTEKEQVFRVEPGTGKLIRVESG